MKISISWEDLGLKGPQKVRDLWRQEDLGVFENGFTSDVNYHGVMLIKVIPD